MGEVRGTEGTFLGGVCVGWRTEAWQKAMGFAKAVGTDENMEPLSKWKSTSWFEGRD